VRDTGRWEVCWLGLGAAELVAALDRWWLARAALVGLRAGLLCSLGWRAGGPSRDVQELAITVEGHWSVGVRRLVLLVVVQEGAIWRFGDRAAMKMLVLQVWWEGRSTERLFDGLEVRSCWDTVEVRRIVAEVLWIHTALISGAEGVDEVSKGCVVHFVAWCVVDMEWAGEARLRKRGIGNLTRHLGNGRKTWCNAEAV
jgi:hypothetical protein